MTPIRPVLKKALQKYAAPGPGLPSMSGMAAQGKSMLDRAAPGSVAANVMSSLPNKLQAAIPQAVQRAVQPAPPSGAAPSAVGFNKPNDHYHLPPDQYGLAFGPRGGAPAYNPNHMMFKNSPAHQAYLDRVKQQYPYSDDQPSSFFNKLKKAPDNVEAQEQIWHDFVDAHPVAENFTAPKRTWFGDNAAALTQAREQALQAELPTPVARSQPLPQAAPQAPPPAPPVAPAPAPTATQPATTTPPTATTPPPTNQPATMMPLNDGSAPSRGAFLTGKTPQKLTTQDYDGYTKQLQSAQTPEARNQVIQDMTARIKPALSTEDTTGANDVLAGNMDSPAAQQFIATKLGPTGESYKQSIVQQELAKQPEKANDPGFFGQVQGMASQMWNSMGPMGQLAMTFGLPAALIGLMGGGGLTSLLGGLGIGALGLGAAGMGLFGEGAQKGVGDLSYNVGTFLGMIPSGKQDLSTLMSDDPVQAAVLQSNLGIGSSTADVKAKLQDAMAKKQQLQSLLKAPVPDNIKAQWLMRMDPERIKTPEDAMRALRGAGTLVSAFDDPNSAIAQKIQDGQAYTSGQGMYGTAGRVADSVHGIRQTLPSGSDVWNTLTSPSKWNWFGGRQGVKQFHAATSRDYLQQYIDSWATKNVVDLTMKSARCWAGYEPVPGKKPYSNDSCRPVSSNKKAPKKKTAK